MLGDNLTKVSQQRQKANYVLSETMVSYWRYKDAVAAKVMTGKDGALVMKLEGEKELFPGFPRSHSLFGTLSPLKHQIKNQIFNDSWWKLERGEPKEEIIADVKEKVITGLQEYMNACRYDMVPPERMVAPVRELWRAFSVIEQKHPNVKFLKEAMTFVMQEDDAYRFRLQWIVQIFNPSAWWFRILRLDPVKWLEIALGELKHAEVVGDMKLKQDLLKRIISLLLEDKQISRCFREFVKEVDWNKLKLSKADKYHFRGKYFKVDFDRFSY